MKKLAAILLAFSVLLSLSACGQAGGQAAPTESPVLTTAEPTPSAVINGEMPDDEYDRAIWYGFIDPDGHYRINPQYDRIALDYQCQANGEGSAFTTVSSDHARYK